MIGMLIIACATQEYVLPQAEVFEDDWEGSLSFVSYQGSKEVCSMHYSMDGESKDCEECIWEADFTLEPISESCAYPDLSSLSFRVGSDNTWLVLEESGWEEWGEASVEDGAWSFISSFHFFP